MPTYAALSADMLKDAAAFFRNLAGDSDPVQKDMTQNAAIFEQMAELLKASPVGMSPSGQTYNVLAGKLLHDTAKFYRHIASIRESAREYMEYNAAKLCDLLGGKVIYPEIEYINKPNSIMDNGG